MSTSSNVISLAAARRDKERIKIDALPYERLSEKIVCIAHRYVSPGAVLLLTQIARFLDAGEAELSYKFLCSELRITDCTLSKYILELEDTQFIRVRRAYIGRKINATNKFEIDFNGPLGAPMPPLRMPKKFNERGYQKNSGTGEGVPEKSYTYSISTDKGNTFPKGNGRSAPRSFDTISEATEFTEKRIVRKRAEKVEKATRKGGQLTLAGVKATWATAMLKHYPTVPVVSFSTKEFAVLKMKIQPILTTCNMSEFFDYIVSSWKSLRESKFIWLRVKGKDVAVAPSLPELMRYFKVFAQAFADSRMQEAQTVAGSVRSREDVLTDQLAAERASKALISAEAAKLKDRLSRVEKIAYGRKVADPEQTSLSARQKALDEAYNENDELPQWK